MQALREIKRFLSQIQNFDNLTEMGLLRFKAVGIQSLPFIKNRSFRKKII